MGRRAACPLQTQRLRLSGVVTSRKAASPREYIVQQH